MPWIYTNPRNVEISVPATQATSEARIEQLTLTNLQEGDAPPSGEVVVVGGYYNGNGDFVVAERVYFSVPTNKVPELLTTGLSAESIFQYLRTQGKLPAGSYQP